MAIRIRLGDYQTLSVDPLGRDYTGYFPRMTEAEAWQVGRGVWKMNRERAGRQRFALIVGAGRVRAIAQITALADFDDRIALEGQLLRTSHPIYDRYIGQRDPADNDSQNPIAYCDLPEEVPFRTRSCGCGCGQRGERDFLPGHDVRAVQARIRERFGGSALRFLNWVDAHLADHPVDLVPVLIAHWDLDASDRPDWGMTGCRQAGESWGVLHPVKTA